MELSEILNWVFGGTTFVSIVLFFIFFKQNKRDRQDERMDAMENFMGNVVTFLNGDFQKFLINQK